MRVDDFVGNIDTTSGARVLYLESRGVGEESAGLGEYCAAEEWAFEGH